MEICFAVILMFLSRSQTGQTLFDSGTYLNPSISFQYLNLFFPHWIIGMSPEWPCHSYKVIFSEPHSEIAVLPSDDALFSIIFPITVCFVVTAVVHGPG